MWWPLKLNPPIQNLIPVETKNTKDSDEHGSELAEAVLQRYYSDWDAKLAALQDPLYATALSSFILGSISALTSRATFVRYFKRIPNSGWVTPDIIKQRRWLKGVVTSVGDGDGFRFYHTPAIGWNWPLEFRRIPKKLTDRTISVRLAGADAPEGKSFGKPGQPYAKESKEWLKGQILGKTLYCQVVGVDQYKRIVAMPMFSPRILPGFLAKGKCVSLELVRAGYAVTYEREGGYYGEYGREEFLRIEALAKEARKGMWKDGIHVETPAEYKSRHAGHSTPLGDDVDAEIAESTVAPVLNERPSWLRRVFTRGNQTVINHPRPSQNTT